MPYPPLSHSSLTDFEECPKRFAQVRLLKNYKIEDSQALIYGRECHSKLENFINTKKPVSKDLLYGKSIVEDLETKGYTLSAEIKIAINKNLNWVDYWNPKALFRGVIDLLATRENETIVIDWKTGKIRPKDSQLKFYAMLLKRSIKGTLVWLMHNKKTPYEINDIDSITSNLQQRSFEMIDYLETNKPEDFIAKPNRYCKWCPVYLDCDEGGGKSDEKYLF
jgi:CRISPR/Cas system-associated exonuclease Cas4 (RecB family)